MPNVYKITYNHLLARLEKFAHLPPNQDSQQATPMAAISRHGAN